MTNIVRERHDVEQNTEEWYRLRAGIPTASEFKKVLADQKRGGVGRRKYAAQLAAEIITGALTETYKSEAMERGHEQEPEIRRLYEFVTDREVEGGAFWTRTNKTTGLKVGCSPDGLIGDDGGVEFKSAEPHILVDYIELDRFPPEHTAQCQGVLWITERKWIDICIGAEAPGLPLFIKRMQRDESYFAKLEYELTQFNDEVQRIVERLRNHKGPTLTPVRPAKDLSKEPPVF